MITDGGIRMPSVPPAAIDTGGERIAVAVVASSTDRRPCDIVAAVAMDDPQIEPKPAQATIGGHRQSAAPVADEGVGRAEQLAATGRRG